MPKFEIAIRVTATELKDFETADLAAAYAFNRAVKSERHGAVVMSVKQVDPPLPDRECPGCAHKHAPAVMLRLPAPPVEEFEIDLGPQLA